MSVIFSLDLSKKLKAEPNLAQIRPTGRLTKDFFTDLDRIFLKPLIITLTLSPTLSTLQPPCYYFENKVITWNQQNS